MFKRFSKNARERPSKYINTLINTLIGSTKTSVNFDISCSNEEEMVVVNDIADDDEKLEALVKSLVSHFVLVLGLAAANYGPDGQGSRHSSGGNRE